MPEKNDFYKLFNDALHRRAGQRGREWLTWAESREVLGALFHIPRSMVPGVIDDMVSEGMINKSRYRIKPHNGGQL